MNYVQLKDVCVINMGQSPDSNSYNDCGEGLPFFQGNADFGEMYPVTRKWCSSPTKIASENDILISVRAPIGALNYAKESCCIGRGLAALTPNKSKVSPAFIFWLLKSKNEELNSKGTGSTFKAIGRKVLEETLIPNISLGEQIVCAKALEKIYYIMQTCQQQLQKLDDLVKARFVELFGDPLLDDGRYCKAPLGCLAQVGSSKRIFEKEYVSEGIPFYRTKEIVELSNGNKISTELFITPKRYNEIRDEYGVPQAGDLLISAVGTIGVIWIVDGKNDFYFKDGNLLRVANSDNFMPVYLKCLLETLICAHKSKMSSGTAYAALTISTLKEMSVYKVPLAEQSQFSTFVSQVDKSKVAVQKSLDEAQLLFDSLMQQYFG